MTVECYYEWMSLQRFPTIMRNWHGARRYLSSGGDGSRSGGDRTEKSILTFDDLRDEVFAEINGHEKVIIGREL